MLGCFSYAKLIAPKALKDFECRLLLQIDTDALLEDTPGMRERSAPSMVRFSSALVAVHS
jgi:hypothetical protein